LRAFAPSRQRAHTERERDRCPGEGLGDYACAAGLCHTCAARKRCRVSGAGTQRSHTRTAASKSLRCTPGGRGGPSRAHLQQLVQLPARVQQAAGAIQRDGEQVDAVVLAALLQLLPRQQLLRQRAPAPHVRLHRAVHERPHQPAREMRVGLGLRRAPRAYAAQKGPSQLPRHDRPALLADAEHRRLCM